MNNYNFRQYHYGDESFAKFLQDNKQSIGVPSNINYAPGSDEVYNSFANDITRSYASDVVIMLNNIKVLIYNGQDDFVVNTAGVLQYLNSLSAWSKIDDWKKARKQIWSISNSITGWVKSHDNLMFVLINKAGHLVPTDQPLSAFDMLGHWIKDDRNWRN